MAIEQHRGLGSLMDLNGGSPGGFPSAPQESMGLPRRCATIRKGMDSEKRGEDWLLGDAR